MPAHYTERTEASRRIFGTGFAPLTLFRINIFTNKEMFRARWFEVSIQKCRYPGVIHARTQLIGNKAHTQIFGKC
jgi:hypothetical protein